MMKGKRHMKTKTHLQSPSCRQFPSLALLFAGITLLAFAPQPVRAGPSYPFQAKFISEFESAVEFPYLRYTVNAQGQATYMNRPSAHTDDQLVNLIDGSFTATYTLTPASRRANGGSGPIQDTLVLTLVVPVGGTINMEGGFLFSGSYTITGGTGRFTGATGSGVFGGLCLYLTETDGIGAFAVTGAISFLGD